MCIRDRFRGLYVMMDRLDILLHRDEIQKSAEENKDVYKRQEEDGLNE